MSYDTYSYTMRIVGRNKKGQKILITVPDLDDPSVIMEAARAAQSAARMSAVLATVNQASADGSGDGEGSSPGSTPTPTPTATSTPSPTPTATPLAPTDTPTPTPTATSTPSPTPTATSSPTPTPTVTPTPTPTITPTPTNTPTPTPTPTVIPIDPNDPNLQIWYNATNTTNYNPTNPTNETFITSWVDQGTSNPHDANTSGNTGVKPRYRTNIQNGLPALYFDGVNDLFTVNPLTTFHGIQQYTYFIVLKTDAPATNQVMTVMKTSSTEVKELYLADISSNWNVGAAGGAATAPATVDTNFHVFTLYFDGTQTNANVNTQNALRMNFRIDGSAQTLTFTANVGSTTNANTTYLYIGTDTSGNNDFDGYIGEIVIYNKLLTLSEIANVEGYLKGKWGTP